MSNISWLTWGCNEEYEYFDEFHEKNVKGSWEYLVDVNLRLYKI